MSGTWPPSARVGRVLATAAVCAALGFLLLDPLRAVHFVPKKQPAQPPSSSAEASQPIDDHHHVPSFAVQGVVAISLAVTAVWSLVQVARANPSEWSYQLEAFVILAQLLTAWSVGITILHFVALPAAFLVKARWRLFLPAGVLAVIPGFAWTWLLRRHITPHKTTVVIPVPVPSAIAHLVPTELYLDLGDGITTWIAAYACPQLAYWLVVTGQSSNVPYTGSIYYLESAIAFLHIPLTASWAIVYTAASPLLQCVGIAAHVLSPLVYAALTVVDSSVAQPPFLLAVLGALPILIDRPVVRCGASVYAPALMHVLLLLATMLGRHLWWDMLWPWTVPAQYSSYSFALLAVLMLPAFLRHRRYPWTPAVLALAAGFVRYPLGHVVQLAVAVLLVYEAAFVTDISLYIHQVKGSARSTSAASQADLERQHRRWCRVAAAAFALGFVYARIAAYIEWYQVSFAASLIDIVCVLAVHLVTDLRVSALGVLPRGGRTAYVGVERPGAHLQHLRT